MGAYQHQPVDIRVHLGVLNDVPVWHPRAHDAKQRQSHRNLDEWEQIRVRIELAPFAYMAVYLL